MKQLFHVSVLAILCALAGDTPAAQASRPNVLFIAIDDLNHWVGHLGVHAQTKTPNIDRLAGMGVSFAKAYCTAPACNPSRASLMSGRRPSSTGCYLNDQNWRPGISEDKLLNSHWRKFALWEEPTRTVFVWKVPGVTPAGAYLRTPSGFQRHLSDALHAGRSAAAVTSRRT